MTYRRTRWDDRRAATREGDIAAVRAFVYLLWLALGLTPEEAAKRLPTVKGYLQQKGLLP